MLDVTFQLVQLGADVNSATVTGRTALLGAAANGHIQTVELLLRCGADPKLKDRNGRSVLVVAKEKGRHDVARLLGDERRVRELQVDRAIAVEPPPPYDYEPERDSRRPSAGPTEAALLGTTLRRGSKGERPGYGARPEQPEMSEPARKLADAMGRRIVPQDEYDRASDADRREVITLQTLEEAIVAARRAAVEPWRVTEAEVRWRAEQPRC